MREVNLTVEVHCHRPPWGRINPIDKYNDSRYRIYINNDLITERNWIWDNNIMLNENIWINAEDHADYTLRVEPIVHTPEQAKFVLDNFKITNVSADIIKVNDLQVNFTLR